MSSPDPAIGRVTRFLDLNYPCHCDDPQCPGNAPEAAEIVRLVREDA